MHTARQTEIRRTKRMVTKLWAAIVTLGLAVVLSAAACGDGGGDEGGSPTAQPTDTGLSTVGPTAAASPSIQPTQQVAASAACQALTALKTYRYISNLTLQVPEEPVPPEERPTPAATLTRDIEGAYLFEYDIDGAVVAPDRLDVQITGGTQNPFGIIIIGDQRWISLEGEWRESPQTVVPYQPMDVCNALFPELNLDQARGEKTTVNDVNALHYVLPATPSGQTIATIFGPTSDMAILMQTMDIEVWTAEKDGWPVEMDIQSKGVYANGRQLQAHIHIELRDINDKDIRVEPPV